MNASLSDVLSVLTIADLIDLAERHQ